MQRDRNKRKKSGKCETRGLRMRKQHHLKHNDIKRYCQEIFEFMAKSDKRKQHTAKYQDCKRSIYVASLEHVCKLFTFYLQGVTIIILYIHVIL